MTQPTDSIPSRSASKAEWYDYARTNGVPVESLDGLTRDEIRAKFDALDPAVEEAPGRVHPDTPVDAEGTPLPIPETARDEWGRLMDPATY